MAKNMARAVNDDRLDTGALLQVLMAVKKGDFSVRLRTSASGMEGKIADTLNDIIEMMSDSTNEIERVSRVVGREGKPSQKVAPAPTRATWNSRAAAVDELIAD